MGKKFSEFMLFLLVTAAAIALTLYVGKDQRNVMIYNFVFLGIMVVVYLIGMFSGMFRLEDLTAAFRRATDELKTIFKKPGKAELSHLQVLDGIFDNKYLDRKIDNFTSSISNTVEGIEDLEDYINEEEIDIHIHKRLLEMVPDIFTSLGILGTFVGLVWGLKDFQPSSYQAMTASVSSLVDGIKVAFLTSIYGIGFSIIYTLGMKTGYSHMCEALTGFMERFHAFVLPTAENESRNLLVASQKVQTEAMNQMADQFSTQLAGSFEKVITPTFQKMNTSLDTLVNTVSRCQEEAIAEIVNEFLRQMNANFKGQFADFGKSLGELKQAVEENTNFTRALYQSLSEELTESYAQQNKILQDMMREISVAQNQYIASSNRVIKENQDIQKAQQKDYLHVVEYLREAERSASKFWVACNQAMQKYLDAAAQGMEQANASVSRNQELLVSSQKIAEDFAQSMKDYAQSQAMTYKTMEKVRILLSDITAAQTQGAGGQDIVLVSNSSRNEEMERLERVITEQSENQQQVLNEMNKNIRDMSKTIQKGKLGGIFK